MESSGVEGESEILKAVFLPFITPSHLVPVVDIARIFAMHGVDVTIIATPANAAIFQSSIDRDSSRGRPIRTHTIKFPQISGLPEGMESINASTPKDMTSKIVEGMSILERQFRQAFRDMKPDFIVSDMFYPWSVEVAAELEIPRLIYVGGTYFAHCAMDSLERFEPHNKVGSDDESFLLPGLPHQIEMIRSQLPIRFRNPNHQFGYLMKAVKESEKKSYGSVLKSFHEFEGDYEEHYKKIMGTKSWNVGPISSWVNQDASDKAGRGHAKEEEEEEEEEKGKEGWLAWLDSKKEDSVLYVCFGSMNNFPSAQLVEIAHALEDSGHDFLWVVRKVDEGEAKGFVEEFEKRVQASNKGYLIWGWAPQLLILEHPAIGAVVTHCGMNTVIESVDAGLPLVTWPLFSEQFFNEKLLVDVLKIGVPVGAKKWRDWNELGDEIVKREDIGKAIALLMSGGEESLEIRKRAKAMSVAAKKAIQVGGSSYNSLKELIEELRSLKLQKANRKMEEPLA
ncbi:soyasapogenol B glucuronide galactosyltransferase [Cajanus cajan]|uniref:soyasapogenol B glucuronide galactosyltransferase n=1 Tax=Cajanus cajan TaxID=3821 RepID=UPI0010FB4580|nr:soyasapogenol B glucuronide galactosyltransferase [Cajanus cajan]